MKTSEINSQKRKKSKEYVETKKPTTRLGMVGTYSSFVAGIVEEIVAIILEKAQVVGRSYRKKIGASL